MEYYSAIKKKYIWISSNEVDETGAYYTEWSKPDGKTPIQWVMSIYLLVYFLLIRISSLFSTSITLASSVQFSRSVMSDSLRPHESRHTRPPCPSPTPRVHSNSHPSSQWCHPAISSSIVPFSSCPRSLPASESFTMSQLFAWGGQSTGVSALASFLPKTCFLIALLDPIFLSVSLQSCKQITQGI